jgi:transposase
MGEMETIPKSEYDMLKELPARLAALESELSLLKNGRNSRTSSTPPSQDIGKSNAISLRPKSPKQSGGQSGHKGHTLLMTEHPDQVFIHSTTYCKVCGTYLGDVLSCEISRRQEIEPALLHPVYIEHQSHVKECPCCGKKNAGDYPCHIQSPVQYGSSEKSMESYLSVYPYLPCQRIKRLLCDLFNLRISEGSIANLLGRMSGKAEAACQKIQKHLSVSEVVGSDETGCRVGGKKHWFHVWQDNLHTFIVSHTSRGYKVIAERFPRGFEHSIHVSDCWAARLKTVSKRHQLCIAHLLRE